MKYNECMLVTLAVSVVLPPRWQCHAMVTNHLRAPYGVYFTKNRTILRRPYGARPAAGRIVVRRPSSVVRRASSVNFFT